MTHLLLSQHIFLSTAIKNTPPPFSQQGYMMMRMMMMMMRMMMRRRSFAVNKKKKKNSHSQRMLWNPFLSESYRAKERENTQLPLYIADLQVC
jgi:hypothetical protein